MSGLSIKDVTKQFGDFKAVKNVELTVPHGTFVCLLGPSGCGKTTLLRMIAGLDLPTSGAIELDGKDITNAPTHQRDLGMVFQSLALFPHLTVGENIAYPLRIRRRSEGGAEKARRRTVGDGPPAGLCRSPGVEALGRPAPARRHRPRAVHFAKAVSCWTSRSPRSMRSCARPCRSNCASSSSGSASPRSSSPMTSARR